jgi:cytochrome c553
MWVKNMRNVRFATVVGLCVAVVFLARPAAAQDDNIDAKVAACAVCHGANGVPLDPKTMPIIWGQRSDYLFKQLHDFRSGDRSNPIMTAMAKGLAQEDLRKIAAYFNAKTWPANPSPAPGATPPAGIDQCRACHQPNFEGGPPAPRLAGLSFDYLLAQMNAFADGTRTNNLDMPGFMKVLTPDQREAMAKYISGL